MIDWLRKILFVRKCLLCGEILSGDADTIFCPKCRLEYEKLKNTPCPLCGKRQTLCRCAPPALAEISCAHLFLFDGELSRRIIYTLKRKNLRALQRFLAQELAALSLTESLSEAEISYAPRTPKNKRIYGFDQAKMLAKFLSAETGFPTKALFCHVGRKEQKTLSAMDRAKNAEASYALCRGAASASQTLILVDDVLTTGSTMHTLIELAKQAGYSRVIVLAVARTASPKNQEAKGQVYGRNTTSSVDEL